MASTEHKLNVRCPDCKKAQGTMARTLDGIKRCVYCGKSFRIRNHVIE